MPKVELGKIAVQVLLRDVMERPGDPTLENAKIAFNRVCVHVTAHIFAGRVIDLVAAEDVAA